MESYLVAATIFALVGLLLLAGEFFMPTGGFLIVTAVVLFAVAIGIIFYYGTRSEALVSVIALCIGLPAIGAGMFHAWKRFAITSGLDPQAAGGSVTSAVPELAGLERLIGRHGKTITPMRPSGSVEIDGRRVDALTEGMMVDADVWVRCVEIRAGRVIVRKVDAPKDLAAMNLDDLQ